MISKSKVSGFKITKPESPVLLDVKSGYGQPIDTIVAVEGEKRFQEFGEITGKPIDLGSNLKGKEVNIHVMAQDKNTNTDNFDVSITAYEKGGGTSVSMDYQGKASKQGEILVMDLILFCL